MEDSKKKCIESPIDDIKIDDKIQSYDVILEEEESKRVSKILGRDYRKSLKWLKKTKSKLL